MLNASDSPEASTPRPAVIAKGDMSLTAQSVRESPHAVDQAFVERIRATFAIQKLSPTALLISLSVHVQSTHFAQRT